MKEQRSAGEIERYARQLVRRHGGSLSQKTIRGRGARTETPGCFWRDQFIYPGAEGLKGSACLRAEAYGKDESGIRIDYVDEVTLLGDFIDCASLFSDVHAAVGMKIVLSGTDSLGFRQGFPRTILMFFEYSSAIVAGILLV